MALRELIASRRRRKALELEGKIDWRGDLEEFGEALSGTDICGEMIDRGEPQAHGYAGQFISLISGQIGQAKNDFLRRVIAYEYPDDEWQKYNYRIRLDTASAR